MADSPYLMPPAPKLSGPFLSLQHRQSKFRVSAITLHALEHASGRRGNFREHRIVLDVAERLLARQRNLHAGVEQVLRVERTLHPTRELEDLCARRPVQQWRAQPAVAVLARK